MTAPGPDLVLDLRDGFRNLSDGLRLTRATATGSVDGYTVESQRRSAGRVKGLAMRLSTPDGRVLNVASHPGISASNAKSPVSGALSHAVGYVFRGSPSQKMRTECVAAIEATITAGLECLSTRTSGREARILVQCAAHGLDPEPVHAWLNHPTHTGNLAYTNRVGVREVGILLAHGFSPETMDHYFPYGGVGSVARVKAGAAFRDHGWVEEQMDDLARLVVPNDSLSADRPGAHHLESLGGWARLGYDRAMLAARAGLSAESARRLIRRGDWDEAALRTLAALRG